MSFFIPNGPTIPGSANLSSITSGNITSNGQTIGFFGKSAPQQNLDDGSLDSVIKLLQAYGLSMPPLWSQQGTDLIGSGESGLVFQGFSVDITGDGNTIVLGGYGAGGFIGAVWIFVNINGIWTEQGPSLVGTGSVGQSKQGFSLALSNDGNTLAVGGNGDNSNIGAVWIFTRSGGIWTQQGSKLVGTGNIGNCQQGKSVSLSHDGNTLAVGGSLDNGSIGAVWIFTRTGGVWTQQGSKLVGTGNIGNCQQGQSVSLSADGTTLAVGGNIDNSNAGAVWIFTQTMGVWTQQGSKLVGTGGIGPTYQGQSVSISYDGNTLAIGGQGDNGFIGAVWIFKQILGVWTQQGSKLVGSGYIGTSQQGVSIALSGNALSGNADILVIGGNGDNNDTGATWTFTNSNDTWSQYGPKLIGNPINSVASTQLQGSSVAVSELGNIIITGSYFSNLLLGSGFVFVRRD